MASDRHTNYFVHTLLRARDWQHRPEFDQVCAWWRKSSTGSQPVQTAVGRGVCALVGMGGAGKTAIADRFLNELLDDTSTTRKRVSPPLPPPHSVFVYSFYDDDKPENFFRHLQVWLEGTSAPEREKSATQLMFDIQQHQGLIILDGLERVQESGARGGFGRLTSPSLRDLLNHIASGAARELSMLVTSRFPLTDLRDSQPRFFHTIAVDQIDVAAGVALLRERGVRGSDVQLAPIVEHCGRHALTVDLAGGYIKEYGHGDPSTSLNLGTAEELQAEAEQELDDDKRAVLIQSRRFTRIAQRYREAMLSSDEAALALLERICLFRLGVECETLAAIFTGSAAEKVSGKALARLDADQLQQKLDWLARMRIIERTEFASLLSDLDSRLLVLYSIHPAVRDGFVNGISRDAAQASHQAVRRELEVSLGDAPGENPSDPVVLAALGEMVHHALAAGFANDAFNIYWSRIGGYRNLGWRLGAYERGEQLCRLFYEQKETLIQNDWYSGVRHVLLMSDWALYLFALGRLRLAKANSEEIVNLGGPRNLSLWSTANQNLSMICTVSGRLDEAKRAGHDALTCAQLSQDAPNRHFSHLCHAYPMALRGEVKNALDHFAEAQFRAKRSKSDLRWGDESLYSPIYTLVEVAFAAILERIGRVRFAERIAARAKKGLLNKFGPGHHDLPKCNAILSSLTLHKRDLGVARQLVIEASDWAAARDAKEVLCWTAVVQARISLSAFNTKSSLPDGKAATHLAVANGAINHGVEIARDCGYGLYHIDLLLERARLHLLRGDPGAGLEDIEVALDTGIPANEETGQVELLAANHEECGYAWAIPAGLQLRAEALLLQAAQTLGRPTVAASEPTALAAGSEQDADTVPPAASAVGSLWTDVPANIAAVIDQAKQLLHEALDRWHDLRDPEPTEDNNFKLDGKEYNYRAAETQQVLVQLAGGVLTRYPLKRIHEMDERPESTEQLILRLLSSDIQTELTQRQVAAVKAWLEANQVGLSTIHAEKRARGKSEPLRQRHHIIAILSFNQRIGLVADEAGTIRQPPIQPQPKVTPLMESCEIILFAANPAGTRQLALDKEVREIESKIQAAEHRDKLKLISKWAARSDDLIQALNQHHDAKIIHFSGHGSTTDEIILAGNDGQAKPVNKAAMSALLKTLRGKIRLVILNACFSRPQAEGITEHIDCAIGMNKAIGDDAAIIFAASVYRAIGFGKSVQEAFDQGIAALLLEGIPEENTPELLCKKGVDPKQVYLLSRR